MWRVFSRFFDPFKGLPIRVQAGGRTIGGFTSVAGLADISGTASAATRGGVGAIDVPQEMPEAVRQSSGKTTITFKRGMVDRAYLFQWSRDASVSAVAGLRDIVVEMRDEVGKTVAIVNMRQCAVEKYTGPTLSSKGTGTIAIEELALDVESVEVMG